MWLMFFKPAIKVYHGAGRPKFNAAIIELEIEKK
jgi:hypothetical protein